MSIMIVIQRLCQLERPGHRVGPCEGLLQHAFVRSTMPPVTMTVVVAVSESHIIIVTTLANLAYS